MLNLGCVWDSKEYGPDAPAILFDMISRNLPEGTEGQFFAFTDFEDDLGPWIIKRSLRADRSGVRMFPLNCAIVRPLDAMLEGKQVSTCFYDGSFPQDAAVVIFNDCHPKDCNNWVKHVWKIGGCTTTELKFTPNVSKGDLRANILSASERGCQWFEPRPAHDETALIVGGGPSLRDDIDLLKLMAQQSQVFALNGVPAYLAQNGIIPDFHVMLDAHPDCLAFVAPNLPMIRYYASQCTPEVLDAAGTSLVGWHGGGEAMNLLGSEGKTFLHVVGGGSTGATRAMILAYGLGYRKFHLFGMDSSYEGDAGHAYAQADYLNFLDVTCGDQVFKTTPQLLGQAEDFKTILPDLIRAACEVTVHGDGLLRAVATQMAA